MQSSKNVSLKNPFSEDPEVKKRSSSENPSQRQRSDSIEEIKLLQGAEKMYSNSIAGFEEDYSVSNYMVYG